MAEPTAKIIEGVGGFRAKIIEGVGFRATIIARKGRLRRDTINFSDPYGGGWSKHILKRIAICFTHDNRIVLMYSTIRGKTFITVDRLFVVQETKTGLSEPKEITS